MAATRDHSVHAHHIVLYYLAHIALLVSFYPARLLFRLWCWLQRMTMPVSTKRVVIIGGGFCGSRVARHLQYQCDLTMIDTKDFFEFTPSILRCIVEPEHAHSIQIRHSEYLPGCKCIRGVVSSVSDTHVIVENWWKPVPYDILVIATGSTYNQPFKEANAVIATRASVLSGCAKQLELSESVLVIGGGTVGVELAAEIIEKFPDKRLSMAHSRKHILSRVPDRAREYVQSYFHSKENVSFRLGTRVNEREAMGYRTTAGELIEVDVAFMCTGIVPNSSFLSSLHPLPLDERGFARVNKYLQLEGHPRVFVAGDVSGIKEEKLAQAARYGAKAVIHNVRAMLFGWDKLNTYTPRDLPMIISLGKYDAVSIWRGMVFTGLAPAVLKEAVEWLVMVQY